MYTTYILVLLAATCSRASCQKLPPGALTALIQEMLSPGKSDQDIQIIKGTAPKIGVPEFTVNRRSVVQETDIPRAVEMTMPFNRRPTIIETGLPPTIVRNEAMPRTVVVEKTDEMGMPRNVVVKQVNEFTTPNKLIMQDGKELVLPQNVILQKDTPNNIVVQKSNEFGTPKLKAVIKDGDDNVATIAINKIIIKKPKLDMPNKVLKVVKNSKGPNRKILVQKAGEIPLLKNLILATNSLSENDSTPKRIIVQKKDTAPQIRTASGINIIPDILMKPKVVEYITEERVVTVNPFLPAASPVSALAAAATAGNGVPQSRGQYLRKIPIPPPTI